MESLAKQLQTPENSKFLPWSLQSSFRLLYRITPFLSSTLQTFLEVLFGNADQVLRRKTLHMLSVFRMSSFRGSLSYGKRSRKKGDVTNEMGVPFFVICCCVKNCFTLD